MGFNEFYMHKTPILQLIFHIFFRCWPHTKRERIDLLVPTPKRKSKTRLLKSGKPIPRPRAQTKLTYAIHHRSRFYYISLSSLSEK